MRADADRPCCRGVDGPATRGWLRALGPADDGRRATTAIRAAGAARNHARGEAESLTGARSLGRRGHDIFPFSLVSAMSARDCAGSRGLSSRRRRDLEFAHVVSIYQIAAPKVGERVRTRLPSMMGADWVIG